MYTHVASLMRFEIVCMYSAYSIRQSISQWVNTWINYSNQWMRTGCRINVYLRIWVYWWMLIYSLRGIWPMGTMGISSYLLHSSSLQTAFSWVLLPNEAWKVTYLWQYQPWIINQGRNEIKQTLVHPSNQSQSVFFRRFIKCCWWNFQVGTPKFGARGTDFALALASLASLALALPFAFPWRVEALLNGKTWKHMVNKNRAFGLISPHTKRVSST